MNNPPLTLTVRTEFFAPLTDALKRSTHTRLCSEYSDEQHLQSGIGRVIDHCVSGREWVQRSWMKFSQWVSVGTFFAALRSPRRLRMVEEVAWDVYAQVHRLVLQTDDPLALHPELNGFSVFASDGHTHAASAHEKPWLEKKRPVTHLYALNLRTHTLMPLAIAEPQKYKKKEHEINTLKRIGGEALRLQEPKGVKVIHVYDPAIVDYAQWQKWKQGRGVYILTLEKKNSAMLKVGDSPWDRKDPRNTGVMFDELVGTTSGRTLRRVIYEDPVTGKLYHFLLNEFTLPPGLVAFLYKLRWDVEKTFDQIKNKTFEQKAWASHREAKKQQALFISLAHNLMRGLEMQLMLKEDIRDQKAMTKRRIRMEKEIKQAEDSGRRPNPLVTAWTRATQRCFQFIRWLRYCLEDSTPWAEALDLLRPLMAKYL